MKRIGTMLGGLLLCLAAEAEVAVANGYTWTYRVLNGKAIITDFTPEPSGRFVIPSSLDGYPVEEIGIYDNNLAYPFSYVKGGARERDYYACHEIVVSDGIKRIGDMCFSRVVGAVVGDSDHFSNASVTNIVLPTSLRVIGSQAFSGLINLFEFRIPEGVTTISISALPYCDSSGYSTFSQLGSRVICPESFTGWVPNADKVGRSANSLAAYTITYLGVPPTGEALEIALHSCYRWYVSPKNFDAWMWAIAAYSGDWGYMAATWTPLSTFGGVATSGTPSPAVSVSILSGGFRKGNPRVYDLVYQVNTSAATAKVRALGVVEKEYSDSSYGRWGSYRSYYDLADYIRPSNWIEGTEANVGDAIAANVPHKLSWRISDEERDRMGGTVRLSVRVLARTGELLPVHVVSLPSSMKFATTSTVEYNGYANYYCDQEYMTGAPAMKVSLDAFTDLQLENAVLFAYAAGDDNALSVSWNSSGHYVDLAAARPYLAKKFGFKLLSEVESFTTNYYSSTWLAFKEDRSDRWLDSSRSTETTYTVDKQAIVNRLNDALFHSKTPLMDDWGNSELGFDPWVKFD